ncbi:hypothetical protein CGRA01v4_14481 [Colletotrichum graminicola]|nr:hypothetical protein CGRA01v4_14481 [Colletotrichum graminicola]
MRASSNVAAHWADRRLLGAMLDAMRLRALSSVCCAADTRKHTFVLLNDRPCP